MNRIYGPCELDLHTQHSICLWRPLAQCCLHLTWPLLHCTPLSRRTKDGRFLSRPSKNAVKSFRKKSQTEQGASTDPPRTLGLGRELHAAYSNKQPSEWIPRWNFTFRHDGSHLLRWLKPARNLKDQKKMEETCKDFYEAVEPGSSSLIEGTVARQGRRIPHRSSMMRCPPRLDVMSMLMDRVFGRVGWRFYGLGSR